MNKYTQIGYILQGFISFANVYERVIQAVWPKAGNLTKTLLLIIMLFNGKEDDRTDGYSYSGRYPVIVRHR